MDLAEPILYPHGALKIPREWQQLQEGGQPGLRGGMATRTGDRYVPAESDSIAAGGFDLFLDLFQVE
jgi:hypothetical protein